MLKRNRRKSKRPNIQSVTMSLITNKNIKNIRFSEWPNPYGLTEKDQKGFLIGMPLEIITLAMKRFVDYHEFVTYRIERLQSFGLNNFVWRETKEGLDFWNSMDMKNYDVFYEKYTPKSLEKELKKTK